MDLKMNVYTPGLELIGLLEVQNSAIWETKAFGAGSFSVSSILTKDTRPLLAAENIIWIAGDDAGVIEYINLEAKDSTNITVKGCNLTGLLSRRILWGRYDLTGTPPQIMHYLVNDCAVNPTRGDVQARKIPGLVLLDTPTGGTSIRIQRTGGELLETLEELGATYGVAFGVRFNPAVPQMEFWTRWGVNRSIQQTVNDPVFYSTELDDVLSSQYTYNSGDYRNVALIAGGGEGNDRVMVTVEGEDETYIPDVPTPDKYTVNLSVDPSGGGVATGGGTVNGGSSITVTAAPAQKYGFVGWRENGAIVSTEPAYTFTVNRNRNLTAVFVSTVTMYTVTATIDPAGAGAVTGAGQYQDGAQATITATPAEGYTFSGWTENGATVSTSESYTFTVTGNRAFVAGFAEAKPSRLPAGYREVLYIQSDGNQFIDTGYVPTVSTKTEVDIEPTSIETSDMDVYFGMLRTATVSGSTKYYGYYAYRKSDGNHGYVRNAGTGGAIAASTSNTFGTQRITFALDSPNSKIVINGAGYEISRSSGTNNQKTMYILGRNYTTHYGIKAKLYSCKIYNSGTLLHDYVPCKKDDGTVGVYDLVGNEFKGNVGSGTFTAGPAV